MRYIMIIFGLFVAINTVWASPSVSPQECDPFQAAAEFAKQHPLVKGGIKLTDPQILNDEKALVYGIALVNMAEPPPLYLGVFHVTLSSCIVTVEPFPLHDVEN